MKRVPVKGAPNFVRDPKSMAIINTDKVAHKKMLGQRAKKNQINSDVEMLKKDMKSIKETMEQIIILVRRLS